MRDQDASNQNYVQKHVPFVASLALLIPESDGQSRVYALLTLACDAEQRTNGLQTDDDGLLLVLACEHTTTTRTCTLAKKSELEDKASTSKTWIYKYA